MAVPKIDWNAWNQPSIAPVMKAVIHFPLGDVTCLDDDISNISFSVPAFDSNYVLFGPPKPATGSLTLVDFDQRFNPTYNSELLAGIEIELFLGLDQGIGSNLVQELHDASQVSYEGSIKYAVPFTTKEPLKHGQVYRVFFTYILAEDVLETVEVEDTYEALFITPDYWPDSNYYGLIYDTNVAVYDLTVQPVYKDFEPYGIFYTQDWEYNSSSHEATVNFVDSMNDALLLDNRRDSAWPSESVNAKDFLSELLELYKPVESNSNTTYTLLYSFYESTQATTINELVTALGMMLFFMPDGTQVLSEYTGFYNTGIVLTDDDVEAYDIQQTSAVTMDSISISACLPTSVESTRLASFSNLILASEDTVPFDIARVMSVDYVATVCAEHILLDYNYTVADLIYNAYSFSSGETFAEFTVYGNAIEVSELPVYSVLGSAPYEIKGNPYIQTVDQARYLASILDAFIDVSFRIIKVSLRGCYGLWVGAKLHINSALYAINADYVVIELDFSYNGAVSTTLTLQRIV